jgi:epoxyqueuosine reductase
LIDSLRNIAADEGFTLAGVTPAVEATGFSKLVEWIESGFAGQMHYFAERQAAYHHPAGVLEHAKSIIALAYPYSAAPHSTAAAARGRVARYVWEGLDYHDTIHPKLKLLCQAIQATHPQAAARGVVDTAPLLEREFAQLAGLGWRGKNTLLLNKQFGSYFFLACVLTDLELPYDRSHESSHCGTCTACLDACPTNAFVTPGVLNATRCISYLTIEHRDSIPVELREGMGDWVFGCDVCQDVCPWNRKPARHAIPPTEPLDGLDLIELFAISDDDFRAQFRKTPLWRTRRRGMLRNAAIVLGNQRASGAVGALVSGLNDSERIVRAASAWALGKIGGEQAKIALLSRRNIENCPEVSAEIRVSLGID